MKTQIALVIFIFLLLVGCQQRYELPESVVNDTIAVPLTPPSSTSGFTKYVIAKGQHYPNNDSNTIVIVKTGELKFIARFDSSAIYTTANPNNQADINKLYGFSDNNAFHHFFSARFGWNWYQNALHLWAYNYNDSTREFKDLGTIAIGKDHNCSIKVQGNQYIFTLNGKSTAVKRTSPTVMGEGYKLFPYFGGDETAPHDVTIWIKELQ